MISYGFWQQDHGGGPALGRKLMLNDKPVEVIGVTPASFFGVDVGRTFDVAPAGVLAAIPGNKEQAGFEYSVVALGDRKARSFVAGRTSGSAPRSGLVRRFLRTRCGQIIRWKALKDYLAMKLTAAPSAAGVSMLRETYSDPLRILLGISGLVLLITCANLASLMLARTSARGREMAVRLAIGAGRSRLIRQVLSESLLLSLAGAAAGAVLARTLSRGLVAFLNTANNPVSLDFKQDWRLFAFLLAVSLLTCVLLGLAPALRASRTAPGAAMKTGGHAMTASRGRPSFRGALVVSQVALSLVLLFTALLFTQSLRNLLTDDPGFQTKGRADRRVGLHAPADSGGPARNIPAGVS